MNGKDKFTQRLKASLSETKFLIATIGLEAIVSDDEEKTKKCAALILKLAEFEKFICKD